MDGEEGGTWSGEAFEINLRHVVPGLSDVRVFIRLPSGH
jgi:hypothetical protein